MAVLPLEAARHIAGPLVEHEQAHVPEHAGQEDDLGQELAQRVRLVVEVLVVPQRHQHAEEHVDDPDDDGDLHLEGVQEDNLVGGDLPDGVDAEGVGGAVVAAGGEVPAVRRVNHDGLLAQHLAGTHGHLPRGPGRQLENKNYITRIVQDFGTEMIIS